MALSFKPKTEEELKTRDLLEPGVYDFEVLSAEPDKSKKSGEDMIKLKVGVFRSDGGQQWVWDYLIGSFESKLRHFCDATGLLQKYQAGSLSADDCTGRSGRCKIKIEKDRSGNYPPKNSIEDYVCRPAKPIASPQAHANADDDDLPPF